MDESSVTRASNAPEESPTRAVVADEAFCRQVAALMFCDPSPIRDAFIGEPAEEVLEMVRWALSHEDDEGFDAARVLTGWAEKRRRGVWSGRPHPESKEERVSPGADDPYAELAGALAKYWAEHPGELTSLLDRAEAHAKSTSNGRGT